MGLQIGASIFNQYYNRENLDKINGRKQEFRASSQADSFKRDYEKFKRSCELQLQIEEESHVERVNAIDQELIGSFSKMAHAESLRSHYPLKISPYIISKSVIPICGTQICHFRQEMFCILTNSNDATFNQEILPTLDDMLCYTISTLWNQNSLHTVCYYPNIWKEKQIFCDEDIDNIKSIIITPTIAITPYFVKNQGTNTLIIKVNLWGIGNDIPPTKIKTVIVYKNIPHKYSDSEKNNVLSQLFPEVICALAHSIDIYYWASYYQPPLLPYLIENGQIQVDTQKKKEYGTAYAELYETLALGRDKGVYPISSEKKDLLNNIADINQCNFPRRSIGFLESVVALTQGGDTSSKIIRDTTKSIYKAKTGEDVELLSAIDVTYMDEADFDVISELAAIAKKSGNNSTFQELRDVISRKICSVL